MRTILEKASCPHWPFDKCTGFEVNTRGQYLVYGPEDGQEEENASFFDPRDGQPPFPLGEPFTWAGPDWLLGGQVAILPLSRDVQNRPMANINSPVASRPLDGTYYWTTGTLFVHGSGGQMHEWRPETKKWESRAHGNPDDYWCYHRWQEKLHATVVAENTVLRLCQDPSSRAGDRYGAKGEWSVLGRVDFPKETTFPSPDMWGTVFPGETGVDYHLSSLQSDAPAMQLFVPHNPRQRILTRVLPPNTDILHHTLKGHPWVKPEHSCVNSAGLYLLQKDRILFQPHMEIERLKEMEF